MNVFLALIGIYLALGIFVGGGIAMQVYKENKAYWGKQDMWATVLSMLIWPYMLYLAVFTDELD